MNNSVVNHDVIRQRRRYAATEKPPSRWRRPRYLFAPQPHIIHRYTSDSNNWQWVKIDYSSKPNRWWYRQHVSLDATPLKLSFTSVLTSKLSKVSKVAFTSHMGPYGTALISVYYSPQPDTSLSCKATNTGLVNRAACLFTPQLSRVPNYTAWWWWQRHTGVRNLPRVSTPWCSAETRSQVRHSTATPRRHQSYSVSIS